MSCNLFEEYLVDTRFSMRDEEGNPVEKSYDEVLDRVCNYIEEQEKRKRLGIEIKEIIKALRERKIITATPFLMNAGNGKTRHKGFFSCYPLGPVPDSTKGIMETVLRMVNIYQAAGGVGVDVSTLRKKGALVDNGQGRSSGPVTFLQMFDAVAGTISQGGKRRGALMVQMDWNHPDIIEFIKCKANKTALTNMNISVNVFGEFWKNEELINLIAKSIWECGDPGLLYIENMMKNSPLTSKNARYVNPCGEYVSEPNTACNLLTVNVSELDKKFWWEEARYYGKLACQLGNLILDLDGYPDPEIERMTKKLRPVGVGITGYHKLLKRCGVKFAVSKVFAKMLQASFMVGTMEASALLLVKKPVVRWKKDYIEQLVEKAEKYVTFPWLKEKLRTEGGLVNCLTTVQAPTGSISQLLHVMCTGIEPYFAKRIKRRVKDEKEGWVEFTLEDEYAEVEEITPEQQIDILCAFQEFVHASISKTINLPADATVDDIKHFIKYTYNKNLKGLTAFRETSKEGVITAAKQERNEAGKRFGVTYKFEGPTSLYITANKINGKLKELFVICSKPGKELKSLTDGLGRAISVGLQSGTPPRRFARTLEHLEGEAVFTNPAFEKPSKSICDAVSKVIKTESEEKQGETRRENKGLCPYCGEWSVVRDGGCKKCTTCGYTSC